MATWLLLDEKFPGDDLVKSFGASVIYEAEWNEDCTPNSQKDCVMYFLAEAHPTESEDGWALCENLFKLPVDEYGCVKEDWYVVRLP